MNDLWSKVRLHVIGEGGGKYGKTKAKSMVTHAG